MRRFIRRSRLDVEALEDRCVPAYTVLDIGPGFVANSVNNAGLVAGLANGHAAVWQDGMVTDLGALGGPSSKANDVNEAGQVAGSADTAGGYAHAFLVTPEDTNNDGRADLWFRDLDQNGINDLMLDLGTLGGPASEARSINNLGQVVGRADSSTAAGSYRAFLWDIAAGMQNLGTFGLPTNPDGLNSGSEATAINDRGQVVGSVYGLWGSMLYNAIRPFFWDPASGGALLPHYAAKATGINEAGQIVGNSGSIRRGEIGMFPRWYEATDAFQWQNGVTTSLGFTNPYPYAEFDVSVNKHAQVVGLGYLWQDGDRIDLNTLVDPAAAWANLKAFDINDAAQIVGQGTHEGVSTSFLLSYVTPSQGLALIHVMRGLLRLENGRLKEAEPELREARDRFAKLIEDFPGFPVDRYALAKILDRLGVLFLDTGRVQEAEETGRAARQHLEQLATLYPKVEAYPLALALSHNSLANLLVHKQKLADAEQAFRDCLQLCQTMKVGFPHDMDLCQLVPTVQSSLANVLTELGKPADAEVLYRKAIQARTAAVAEYANVPGHRQGLATTQYDFGLALQKQGERQAAAAQFRQSLVVRAKLEKEGLGNADNRYYLALTHELLGRQAGRDGQRQEAADHYQKAHLIVSALVEEAPEEPLYRSALARSVARQARGQKGGPDALQQFQRGLELQAKLVDEFPNVPRHRQGLAQSHLDLGEFFNHRDPKEAGKHLRLALDLLTKLAEDHPDLPAYALGESEAHNALGNLLADSGDRPAAEKHLRRALDVTTQLGQKYPESWRFRANLAIGFNNLANVLKRSDAAEGEKLYRRALDLYAQLVKDFPEAHRFRLDLAGSHYNLGGLLAARGDRQAAFDQLHQAQSLQDTLVRDYSHIAEYRLKLSMSHVNLGVLHVEGKEWPLALKSFRRAIELLDALTAEYPNLPLYRSDLAKAHFNLGVALNGSGDPGAAIQSWRKALVLDTSLAQDFPQHPDYQKSVTKSRHSLALTLEEVGRRDKSEKTLREALELRETLAKSPGAPGDQSRLGNSLYSLAWVVKDQNDKAARAEARALVERAIALQKAALAKNPKEALFVKRLRQHVVLLARLHLQSKDHAAAAQAAAQLPPLYPNAAHEYRQAALILAECVPLANQEDLARRYGDEAIAMLRSAIKHGYQNSTELKTAPAFESIRGRPDFQKLLAELEAKK